MALIFLLKKIIKYSKIILCKTICNNSLRGQNILKCFSGDKTCMNEDIGTFESCSYVNDQSSRYVCGCQLYRVAFFASFDLAVDAGCLSANDD